MFGTPIKLLKISTFCWVVKFDFSNRKRDDESKMEVRLALLIPSSSSVIEVGE